jgi:NAD(P)-dependent dehydrogenase (short-subunit alcohol dehydrogenase family)
MDIGIKDKLIIVGGGAGGVGTVVSQVLREEGATVEVADIQAGTDLSDSEAVREFFDQAEARHRMRVVGFVSSVYGGSGGKNLTPFIETRPEELEAEFRGTFLAAFYPIQEAVRRMRDNDGGNIVILSSINSWLGLDETPYDCMKGALNRIAPNIAQAHAGEGICATTLILGTIKATPSWVGLEHELARIEQSIPGGRATTAEEVAQLVAFLLSSHATPFNGGEIPADRGWHLRPSFKKEAREQEDNNGTP